MTKELKLTEGMEQYIIYKEYKEYSGDLATMNKQQYVFRFPNNYGASVVKGHYTYGGDQDLWELAVTQFIHTKDNSFDLCYDTDITGDVEGYLTDGDVCELLKKIKELS